MKTPQQRTAIDWTPIDPKLRQMCADGIEPKEIALAVDLPRQSVYWRLGKLNLRDRGRQSVFYWTDAELEQLRVELIDRKRSYKEAARLFPNRTIWSIQFQGRKIKKAYAKGT